MITASELHILLKLQIAVHMCTCTALLMYIISIGLRPTKHASKHIRNAFWACVGYCAFQIVQWAMMFSENLQTVFGLQKDGYEFIWHFVWSPQLSVIGLWFYFTHVILTCPHVALSVKRSAAIANFRSKYVFRSFLTGVIGIIFADILVPIESFQPYVLVESLMAFTVAMTAIELIYKRAKFRSVSLVSPTIAWLYGVWIGAWVVAAL